MLIRPKLSPFVLQLFSVNHQALHSPTCLYLLRTPPLRYLVARSRDSSSRLDLTLTSLCFNSAAPFVPPVTSANFNIILTPTICGSHSTRQSSQFCSSCYPPSFASHQRLSSITTTLFIAITRHHRSSQRLIPVTGQRKEHPSRAFRHSLSSGTIITSPRPHIISIHQSSSITTRASQSSPPYHRCIRGTIAICCCPITLSSLSSLSFSLR